MTYERNLVKVSGQPANALLTQYALYMVLLEAWLFRMSEKLIIPL
jgi:hypothetical protein